MLVATPRPAGHLPVDLSACLSVAGLIPLVPPLLAPAERKLDLGVVPSKVDRERHEGEALTGNLPHELLDFPLMELPPPPSIVLIRVPDTYRRRQIADVVARFIETNAFQQVEGAITVLSPGRVRTRTL